MESCGRMVRGVPPPELPPLPLPLPLWNSPSTGMDTRKLTQAQASIWLTMETGVEGRGKEGGRAPSLFMPPTFPATTAPARAAVGRAIEEDEGGGGGLGGVEVVEEGTEEVWEEKDPLRFPLEDSCSRSWRQAITTRAAKKSWYARAVVPPPPRQ